MFNSDKDNVKIAKNSGEISNAKNLEQTKTNVMVNHLQCLNGDIPTANTVSSINLLDDEETIVVEENSLKNKENCLIFSSKNHLIEFFLAIFILIVTAISLTALVYLITSMSYCCSSFKFVSMP